MKLGFLGVIGQAVKNAAKKGGQFFRKKIKEIGEDISNAVKRRFETDAPKGTKSRVNITPESIEVEIETPHKEIKQAVENAGIDAVKKGKKRVEWKIQQAVEDSQGDLKRIKRELNFIEPDQEIKPDDVKLPSQLFPVSEYNSDKGYIWNKVKSYFENSDLISNAYEEIKQIIIEERDYNLVSYNRLSKIFNEIQTGDATKNEEIFTKQLDNIADEIIMKIDEELNHKVTSDVREILKKHKKGS